MDLTQPVVVAIAALIVLFAPLIPATFLFLVFPDNKVALAGPFAKLSVRASGAFAAYLILVVLMSQLLVVYYNGIQRYQQQQLVLQQQQQEIAFQQQQQQQQTAFQHQQQQHLPVWTVNGKIKLVNQYGTEINASVLDNQVELDTIPKEISHTSGNIQLKLPEEVTGIPVVIVRINGFGDNTIKFSSKESKEKVSSFDNFGPLKLNVNNNVIDIIDPIKIQDTQTLYGIADNRVAERGSATVVKHTAASGEVRTGRSAKTKF